ncbi:MAG: hypothetical protein HKN21_02825 [Candidatus Eisenbacteria bacterium]|uniref:UVR domain-containing protein n=1 Tax=Eiseniibacteriota bacterium TaxID=2212470 RepID=A0A7Y2H155_UNCEI|nr:hypothetical protein [Candidatus Eisenbacteria bacterium]
MESKDKNLCEQCGKNPATVFIKRVSQGDEVEFNVCKTCSDELGGMSAPKPQAATDPLTSLFQGMEETGSSGAICAQCGMTYTRVKETGRVGCAHCYTVYKTELETLLRRIHGRIDHRGRLPRREGEAFAKASKIKRLSDELERAVQAEDYERAAGLRDRLKEEGVTEEEGVTGE